MAKKSGPGTSRKGLRALVPGRDTPEPGRRSATTSSHGLVGRVQTVLPGARRNTKTSTAQRVAAALGKATGGTTARTPATKGMLGIVAGGVGAVAVAKRRRSTHPNRLPKTASEQAVQTGSGDKPQTIETVADPSANTGGDHGGPPRTRSSNRRVATASTEGPTGPTSSPPTRLARIGINLNDRSRGVRGGKFGP